MRIIRICNINIRQGIKMFFEPDEISSLPSPPIGSANAELVVGSTLFLMSSYARGEQPNQLRHIICKHLESLADRDDLTGVLRQLCDQLAIDWQSQSAEKVAVPKARMGWLRLVHSGKRGQQPEN
jgi:hypothetical protein